MYSPEERMRELKLYIKNNLNAVATVRELGYPSHKNNHTVGVNSCADHTIFP